MEELAVVVEKIYFPADPNDPGQWYIIATDKGTVKGTIPWRPKINERLLLVGAFGAYQGRKEFKFTSAKPNIPVNPKDQLHYICERTAGLGPGMEKRIWEEWNENWIEDAEPGVIARFSGEVYKNFRGALNEFILEKEKSEAITWLISKGATMNMAVAAWGEWESQAVGIVQSDCYRLSELAHYGFIHVDTNIRQNFEINDSDERRIAAGVLYAMGKLTETGCTLATWQELFAESVKLLGAQFSNLIVDSVRNQFGSGALVAFETTHNIALNADYQAEKLIWEFVA